MRTSRYHLGRGAPDFDDSMTLSGNIDRTDGGGENDAESVLPSHLHSL